MLPAAAIGIAVAALVIAILAWRSVQALQQAAAREQGTPSVAPRDPLLDQMKNYLATKLESRLGELEGAMQSIKDREARALADAVTRDVVTIREPPPVPAEDHDAAVPPSAPASLPVDVNQGLIVASRSLAAVGLLTITDAMRGEAEVSINKSVEIDHVMFEKWSGFFDFGTGKPYMHYVTKQPSLVSWNAASEQGRLISKGIVEAAP